MSNNNPGINTVKLLIDVKDRLVPIFVMPYTATVLQMKHEIETLSGVRVTEQTLLFKRTLLDDSSCIGDHNMGSNAVIELVIEKTSYAECFNLNVVVSSPTFKMPLKVNQSETVLHLKERIGDMWGIKSTADFNLWHLTLEMKDHQPLHEYFLYEGAEIQMFRTGYVNRSSLA